MFDRTLLLTFLCFSPALLMASSGCKAPADAKLQLRMLVAKMEKKQGGQSQAPSKAVSKPAQPTKRYTDKEIAKILAKIPGPSTEPRHLAAILKTEQGTISCVLDLKNARQTAVNLTALATGQIPWTSGKKKQSGRFYDGLAFHRALTGFIIQTGNPGTHATDGPGWILPREKGTPDGWKKAGAMGMVEASGENHGSQFFITVKSSPHLAKRYTPFGQCTNLVLARKIARAPKLAPTDGGKAKVPKDPVILKRLDVRWEKSVVPQAPVLKMKTAKPVGPAATQPTRPKTSGP